MTTSKTIIWIDDNPARAKTAQEFGATFEDVRNADLAEKVEELLKGQQPRMVILDHILDKTSTTNPLFQRGSTIAEAIKEQWPGCPVIGVTNIDKVEDIDRRTRRTYDALFRYYNFGKYLERIESIANGFALVAKKAPSNATELVALLKPPSQEVERLLAALPDNLKGPCLDASVASSLYRWADHLMSRPGFLYDTLWAATFLGINELGLTKVQKHFEKGKYAGVFSVDRNSRWWSGLLTLQLYKLCPPEAGEFSWNVGRRLDGITPRYYSECYVCDEKDPPETVAYLDSQTDERQPMHLKHTVLHPGSKRELFFEDIRMMEDK
jgi:hypothetical protein